MVPIIVPTLSGYTFDAGKKAGCPTKVLQIVDENHEGFTKAVNRGLWEAFEYDPEFVVILNDDAYPSDRDWLQRMIDTMSSKIGLAGPSGLCNTLPQAYGVPYMEPAMHIVKQLAFFCAVIRCKVFDDIGLLDEEFIHFGSDSDFVLRAAKAGWKSAWVQHVYVVHDHHMSESKVTRGWKAHDKKVFAQRYSDLVHSPVQQLRHSQGPDRELARMVARRFQRQTVAHGLLEGDSRGTTG